MKQIILVAMICFGCSPTVAPKTSAYKPCAPRRVSENVADRAYSVLEGSRIRLLPSNVIFDVPKDWAEMHARRTEKELGIVTSKAGLEALAKNQAPEYIGFCNSVFPADRCAMRTQIVWDINVYDLCEPIAEVTKRIHEQGRAELIRGTNGYYYMECSQRGEWTRITFQYLWAGEDLSGAPVIECYLRAYQHGTVVFCSNYFISRNNLDNTSDILKTVKFAGAGRFQ